ncbi:RapZ C-terminal domain-containing protein [Amycolatopsis pigmentata]|uniref:ATPase n=1 Tax=Amycolatopsis pigmentata TaxID=450801 RepID=A0ABW5G452_9PSEU
MIHLQSFGYLHEGGVPKAVADHRPHLVLDVRDLWRDPHHDPAMREFTGLKNEIRVRVLNQPGAVRYLDAQAAAIAHLVSTRPIRIAIGCAGGRHRSVVAVEQLALILRIETTLTVEVEHLHLHLPVIERNGGNR